MGVLVPEDFPLAGLANDTERRVVEAFRDGLSDSWLVLPDVGLWSRDRDFQLDVVLVHQTFGILDIEVKGHRVQIVGGRWRSGDEELKPQPFTQAKNNAYALRNRIRADVAGLENVQVNFGVAFPNVTELLGHLPPEVDPVQVLTAGALADPSEAIELLATSRWTSQVLTATDVEAIVAILRPDVELSWDPAARHRSSRARLDELCATQLQALERLDVNRRVVALGRAGTGKTRLAMAWANRAFARDDRVLLTCYNEPLADRMVQQMVDDDALRIGPFLRLALGLEGMPVLPVPPDADHAWWTITAVGHLHAHWHEIVERFDTIVVDEAQDFSPAWLAQLSALLDPDGPRRMLIAADPAQELYARGFQIPAADDGWTHCELVSNCRNTRNIGSLLRRLLGGAPAPSAGPDGSPVRFVPISAGDGGDGSMADVVADVVQAELDRLVLDEEIASGDVAVLTFSSRLRDQLVADLGLFRWEDRRSGILCENVHRAKGLESDTVVLVADVDQVPDELLYVGISRAVSELVIIAPPPVGARLKLTGP